MPRFFHAITVVILSLFAGAVFAQKPLPVVELTAGFHRIEAELAIDKAVQARGLMMRKSMPANHGMLFVFAEEGQHCMWMRNTLIPLSVAFLDGKGQILNIEDMKPQTEDSHCSKGPSRYALEMNQGWFSEKGIKPGQQLGGFNPPKPSANQ